MLKGEKKKKTKAKIPESVADFKSVRVSNASGKKGRRYSAASVMSTMRGVPEHQEQDPPVEPHKLTEEYSKICNQIVDDIWQTAWKICSERFCHKNSSSLVCLELRDTWLRILESEWMDLDESLNNVPEQTFKADEPALPLNLDTWARGNLELLPLSVSVMDTSLSPDIAAGGDWFDKSEIDTTIERKSKSKKAESVGTKPVMPKKKSRSKGKKRSKSPRKPKEEATKAAEIEERIEEAIPTKPKAKRSKPKKSGKKKKVSPPKETEPAIEEVQKEIIDADTEIKPEMTSEAPPEENLQPLALKLSEICSEGEELEGEYYNDVIFVPRIPYVCAKPPQIEEIPLEIILKPDYPWEVIKEPTNIPSTSTISDFEDGFMPWPSLQPGGPIPSVVFRLPDETSSQAIRRTKQARKTETGEFKLQEYPGEGFFYPYSGEEAGEYEGYKVENESNVSGFSTKSSRLESVMHQDQARAIASRIDNLAGSDELVQILAPHETKDRFQPRDSQMVVLPEAVPKPKAEDKRRFTIEEVEVSLQGVDKENLQKVSRKTSLLDMKDTVIKTRINEMKRKFSKEQV